MERTSTKFWTHHWTHEGSGPFETGFATVGEAYRWADLLAAKHPRVEVVRVVKTVLLSVGPGRIAKLGA